METLSNKKFAIEVLHRIESKKGFSLKVTLLPPAKGEKYDYWRHNAIITLCDEKRNSLEICTHIGGQSDAFEIFDRVFSECGGLPIFFENKSGSKELGKIVFGGTEKRYDSNYWGYAAAIRHSYRFERAENRQKKAKAQQERRSQQGKAK